MRTETDTLMKPIVHTPKEYLASLPADRRTAIQAVRKTILERLPKGYEEVIGHGMLCYQVPWSVCSDTYNGEPLMYAALASQKSHMAIYLMSAYGSPKVVGDLRDGFKKAGKRLDMGKSCIRFRKLEDLPLDAIGRAVGALGMKAYVEHVQGVQSKPAAKKARKKTAKKSAKRVK
jgi:hypothetical protein